MKKIKILLYLFFSYNAFASFERIEGIDNVKIRRVAFSKTNPSKMAVASENTLYINESNKGVFRKVAILTGEQISHLCIDEHTSAIYLSGTRHCYRVRTDAERIFSSKEGETINFVLSHKGVIYIATTSGLYYARETVLNWRSVPGLSNNAVYSAEGLGDRVYITCDGGLYLLYPGGSLQRLFVTRNDQEGSSLKFNLIKPDIISASHLWLGSNRGLYRSLNQGETWEKFYASGADNISIACLGQSAEDMNILYACSSTGFFSVNRSNGETRAIFEGLPSSIINWMDFSPSGEIYVATDKGLFKKMESKEEPSPKYVSLEEMIKGEPSIQQLQEAALRYNSVHPDKVAKWRKRIKYRALFPKVSLDFDNSIRGSTKDNEKHYFSEGPYDWGVTLSWDMGNLIWNNYEDDIDNRTKLTTQLRLDILDEINRLYFERLRLKKEITAIDPRAAGYSQKELRLLELTATLDGYTGGYFTNQKKHSGG